MTPSPIRNRTLYLVGRSGTTIQARPPGLLVTHRDRAPAHFPLTRVRRIISPASARWDGAALQLVLKEGIPIDWYDGQGEPVGSLIPATAQPPHHAAQLQHFLFGPNYPNKLTNWALAQRTRQIKRWLKHPDYHPEPINRNAHLYQRHGQHPETLNPVCKPLIRAWVAHHLNDQGYPQQTPTSTGELFDMLAYTFPFVWADVNFYAAGTLVNAAEPTEQLKWTDRWTLKNQGAVLSVLGAFTQNLYGPTEKWHSTKNSPGSLPTTSQTIAA